MGHNYVAHLCFPQNVLFVFDLTLLNLREIKYFQFGGKKYSTAKTMYISPGVYVCLSNVSIVSFVMYPSALSWLSEISMFSLCFLCVHRFPSKPCMLE